MQIFTRRTARVLFQNMRLQRWCFDVELIYLANRFRIPIAEENVAWTEVAGSKIRFWSVLSMAFELLMVKAAYTSGAWTVLGEHSAIDS
jgi:dolichyl-phosphate beta-glucosyltransferase